MHLPQLPVTVEHIMTVDLFIWDPDSQSKDEVLTEADTFLFDTIPIRRSGKIDGLLYASSGIEAPLTHDLLISRDTPLSMAVTLLAESSHPALLVLHGQDIVGIITPSDFNKIMSRSYFYQLLAILETTLARCTRAFFGDELATIAHLLRPQDKTTAQFHRKLIKRASGRERDRYALDVVHLLMLSEFGTLIETHEEFRRTLGFNDRNEFQEKFVGLTDFRNKIMHPERVLLSDNYGIKDLNERLNRVMELIEVLSEDIS